MFWGLSMEPQKRYTQIVAESFHISQATIDISSVAQESTPTQIVLEFESNDYLLATLSKNAKIYQVPLDLNFQKGDHVSFRTVGPGTIYLTGYHVFDDDDLESRLMADDDSEEEEDENEEDSGQVSNSDISASGPPGKRKKQNGSLGNNKKSKLDDDAESDEETDNSVLGNSSLLEDEDDDDDDEVAGEEESDDESDEEEDDEEEEEEESEEDSPPKKKSNKNASINGIVKKEVLTPKNEAKKKQEGKNLNKSKPEKTPKQEVKTSKDKKTPKGTPDTPSSSSPGQKKVLEGGVVAEDLKIGEGPVAKPGRNVQVYYVGRLKSNNKQFDATTGGAGFKFRLGRGEVIKGWDIGVSGMKVGGKRRLTIPAGLGYGARGSPPAIPPNATLVFDVELRGIS